MPAVATKPAKISIDDEILDVLKSMTYDGPSASLTVGQLSRPMYARVNKVLEAMGGKWNKKAKAHVFDGEAREIMEDTVHYGEYIDVKKTFQFFETPDELAEQVVRLAEVDPGDHQILEPSAGTGQLLRALQRVHNEDATYNAQCVELDESHRAKLLRTGAKVTIADFLSIKPTDIGTVDRVIMNPPFSKLQDIAHVRHAWDFLAPGGKLVAIMSPAFTYRTDKRCAEFRAWADSIDAEWRENDAGAFKESGTMVRTLMFSADKP